MVRRRLICAIPPVSELFRCSSPRILSRERFATLDTIARRLCVLGFGLKPKVALKLG